MAKKSYDYLRYHLVLKPDDPVQRAIAYEMSQLKHPSQFVIDLYMEKARLEHEVECLKNGTYSNRQMQQIIELFNGKPSSPISTKGQNEEQPAEDFDAWFSRKLAVEEIPVEIPAKKKRREKKAEETPKKESSGFERIENTKPKVDTVEEEYLNKGVNAEDSEVEEAPRKRKRSTKALDFADDLFG